MEAVPKRVISVFVLAMLNVSVMASLRNLPIVSQYGLEMVGYFAAVALLFLVPCALISAELATGWPQGGGIYHWVSEALGERWGFCAIWLQWAHNLSWYPVILSFVAATLAFVFDPTLANNRYYVVTIVLTSFWAMTFLNYLGIKTSSLFSTLGVILGTLLPGLLVVGLAGMWLGDGRPAQIDFSWNAFLPDFSTPGNLVFLSALFLAFAGLEVTATFAREVKEPKRNYPRAILLAALITFVVVLAGALSIALVIPKSQISLVAGFMEALQILLGGYGLEGLLPLLAILLAFGAVAEVNAWIVGPIKGLYATAMHGVLPPAFQRTNKAGTPTALLFFQAICVTACSLVFLMMPSVSSCFWILSAMSAQSYLVMYVLMFIAGIRLRYTQPHVERPYSVPMGRFGMWLLATLGTLASLFAIVIGFFPPEQLDVGSLFFYETFLGGGLCVLVILPLLIYRLKSPKWKAAAALT